jgi:hypothetical protein
MPYVTPQYPGQIWDGLSPNKERINRAQRLDPNPDDWDQIVAELIAVQQVGQDEGSTFTARNGSGLIIRKCQPVCSTGVDTVTLADASSIATAYVLGLSIDVSIADGAEGDFQSDGSLFADVSDWDAVTGQVGGLTSGARYFLSLTAGRLTTAAPIGSGEVWVPIGIALDARSLVINLQTPIKV